MIKEIKITNFYSFSEETIILQPDVNILIGINGSGKSNFLKAVRLLKEGISGMGFKKYIINVLGGFDNIYFKNVSEKHTQTDVFNISYIFDGKELKKFGYLSSDNIAYVISLHKIPSSNNYYVFEQVQINGQYYLDFHNGEGFVVDDLNNIDKYNNFEYTELALRNVFDSNKYSALTSLKKAIDDIMVYDYFDTTPQSLIRKPMLSTSEKRLLRDGSNLPQILNTLKINFKQDYSKIVSMLNEVNSKFNDFDFNFIGGNIELMLDEKGLNSSIHVSSISDGTLKYLCLLAILYNPERGKFICIDEPETGLHPDMITNIVDAIKEASEGSTIIISTHSVDLLNYFNVENLLVFEKDDYNSTKVARYRSEQFKGWYDTFNVGQMWVAGDFGGVRYGG